MEYKNFNPADKITLDVPLFIRLLEYAREDAKTDMDLHKVTENAIALSETGKTLTMDQYDAIVKDGGQEDASYANMANENKNIKTQNMKQINELKRMQQLAGVINESQLNENIEEADTASDELSDEQFKIFGAFKPSAEKIMRLLINKKIGTQEAKDLIKKYGFTKKDMIQAVIKLGLQGMKLPADFKGFND